MGIVGREGKVGIVGWEVVGAILDETGWSEHGMIEMLAAGELDGK